MGMEGWMEDHVQNVGSRPKNFLENFLVQDVRSTLQEVEWYL